MDKRDDLNRLLADCRKGKIDIVLVKSFTRLARNTVDSLIIIRDLKLMGVSVISERERLDTGKMSNEMLVTLWSNMAQEESNSISQNMRWSYRKRMRKGEFITCNAPYGYRLVNGKMLEIDEETAPTIRWIFDCFLSGISTISIAAELDKIGAVTPDISPCWRHTAVQYILKNEKYIGDTLAQKSYSTDTFPYVSKPNKGEKDQYHIKNSHPAIISRDAFTRVQELLKRKRFASTQPRQYPLTRKLYCGACGSAFQRKETANGYACWTCWKHVQQNEICDMPRVSESAVYAAFTRMAQKFKQHADVILQPALSYVQDLQTAMQQDHTGIIATRQELANLTEQAHTLARLRCQNLLDDATWQTHTNEVTARQFELRRKLRILLDNDDLNETIEALEQLIQSVRGAETDGDGFHAELFEEIVQKAVINADGSICFLLPGKVEIIERLEEVRYEK